MVLSTDSIHNELRKLIFILLWKHFYIVVNKLLRLFRKIALIVLFCFWKLFQSSYSFSCDLAHINILISKKFERNRRSRLNGIKIINSYLHQIEYRETNAGRDLARNVSFIPEWQISDTIFVLFVTSLSLDFISHCQSPINLCLYDYRSNRSEYSTLPYL